MELKIDRKEMLSALTVGGSLAGRNKVIPILDNVKLRVKGNNLQVVSIDDQSAIQKRVALLSCDVDGEFAVCASDLLKAVKALKDPIISLVYFEEKKTLVIEHLRGNISLSATSTEDFPTLKTSGENAVTFVVASETLFNWLNTSKSFVASDGVRPVMDGMYMDVKDGRLSVCASDGTKLFTDSVESYCAENVSVVIPSNVFSAIQSVINGTSECAIKVDTTHTTVAVEDAKICVRNIDGRYPNFRAVIPASHCIEVEVNKNDLVDSISRTAICNGAAKIVRMVVLGGTMELNAEDMDFGKSAKETLTCNLNGEGITIGFKHDAILASLSSVGGENVMLQMTDNTRAIILKDTEAPNKIMLTMPCLLN